MKKLFWLAVFTLLLSGCQLGFFSDEKTPPAPIEEINTSTEVAVIDQEKNPPPPPEPPTSIEVEYVKQIDWPSTVVALADKVIKNISLAEVLPLLLVDNVKNITTMEVDATNVNQALTRQLSSTAQFTLVPKSEVDLASQTLGLLADDSLRVRSKTIGLARYLNAPYILFTTIEGNSQAPKITMELMQVQNGELLSSAMGDIIRQ